MTTAFTITAKARTDKFSDNVAMGDTVKYSLDFTPWQEANATITGVTWTAESGNAGISGQTLAAGVATALIAFPDAGRSLISVLAATATVSKKIWLELNAVDLNLSEIDIGDYR